MATQILPKHRTWAAITKLIDDDLPTHAAALAYTAVLTLVPIATGFLLASTFVPEKTFRELYFTIHEIAGPQAANAYQFILQQVQRPDLRTGAGLIAIFSFLILGSALFMQMRSTLNFILKTPPLPFSKWVSKRFLAVTFLFGLIFLITLISIGLTVLQSFNFLIIPFFPLISILVLTAAASCLYRWLPDIRIPWKAAFQGGLFAAILFEIGKDAFRFYLAETHVESAYGAAGVLFLFLIWIYYSSLIFYGGAEVSSLLKEHPTNWLTSLRNRWTHWSWKLHHPILAKMLLGLFLSLLLLRVVAPEIIRVILVQKINDSENWKGKIQDVDLGILRGVIALKSFELRHGVRKDFHLAAKKFELNTSWLPLFKKELHLTGSIEEPFAIIKVLEETKPDKEPIQLQKEAKKLLANIWPIYLRSFRIENGSMRVEDPNENSFPAFRITEFSLKSENVWSQVREQEGPSKVEFSGKTSGQGTLKGKMMVSAFSPAPNFKAELKIENMNLVFLNKFFREKANFDLTSGKLDVYSEFASQNWYLKGYLKPMLKQVKFEDLNPKKSDSFWRKVWEGLLDFVADLFKNDKTKKLAAKIDFEGNLAEGSAAPGSVFASILRNAFVRAIFSGFDRDVPVKPKFPPKK